MPLPPILYTHGGRPLRTCGVLLKGLHAARQGRIEHLPLPHLTPRPTDDVGARRGDTRRRSRIGGGIATIPKKGENKLYNISKQDLSLRRQCSDVEHKLRYEYIITRIHYKKKRELLLFFSPHTGGGAETAAFRSPTSAQPLCSTRATAGNPAELIQPAWCGNELQSFPDFVE